MTSQVHPQVLKDERNRFAAFAFAGSDILLEIDARGMIVFADGATRALLHYPPEEMRARNFLSIVREEDVPQANGLLKDTSHGRFRECVLHLTSRNNVQMPFAVAGFRLPDLDNHLYLTLSATQPADLDARDRQSGLLKKENFATSATKKLQLARKEGKDLKVTLLDLPELKEFVDTMPLAMTHNLVMEIAQYLRSRSVDGDTAGFIGEGAYTMVHEAGLTREEIKRELTAITKRMDPKGVGFAPRTATLETDLGTLTTYDSANALLYSINTFANSKGDEFTIHSLREGYEAMLEDTVAKITRFKQTLATNAFEPAYQPIVDLKTGLIHHFEALVRFEGKGEFESPFHFITFGEQSGMIGDFDLAMCQRALEALEKMSVDGERPRIAINLSGKSLSSNLFMDTLMRLVTRHPKLRKQLILEVTESCRIADMEAANNFLQSMRDGGHLVCLDDFGTGESSFEYLRHLQVDFLKIDGSYVLEHATQSRGQHMLRAIAGLCRDLEITAIGEMVEDEKAATMLWEAGIPFGQGYFFGRPTTDDSVLSHCAKPTPFYSGIAHSRHLRAQG